MERVTSPLALPHLSDLSDEELTRAYAPLAEPWLRVNFVSTVDGAVALAYEWRVGTATLDVIAGGAWP